MTDDAAELAVRALLDRFHAAFAAGDAEGFGACFAEDGTVVLLHSEALVGRDAIVDAWRTLSARFDTSDWEPVTEFVDVDGDHGAAYSTYTERLLDRQDGSRRLVRGRLVHLFRAEPDGTWRIRLLMNSHSRPIEPLP